MTLVPALLHTLHVSDDVSTRDDVKVTLLFIPKFEIPIGRQPVGKVCVLESSFDHGLTQIKISFYTWKYQSQ
jgi:hypothetical protein